MDKEYQAPAQALTGLFQRIISDIKASGPAWEDVSKQAVKLQSQLKNTVAVLGTFLDAFQKVADLANNSPGATKDIGAGLTRLCVRHRNLETKLKTLTSSLSDCFVQSLQESVEEWKKNAAQLDKDHGKEYKRAQQEIKKACSESLRLKKKAKKGGAMKTGEMFDVVGEKHSALEETESVALRSALMLQRSHFCQFFHHISPMLEKEMDLLGELEHMKEVMDHLSLLTSDLTTIPPASEQVITELRSDTSAVATVAATAAGDRTSTLAPPAPNCGSQVSLSSQHSSHKSSHHSESSCSLQSLQSTNQEQRVSTQMMGHNPTNQMLSARFVSSSLAGIPSADCYRQISSVSSQDSGFVSQEIPTVLLAGDVITSPALGSASLNPPRSFIHPNLNILYADSPDRGYMTSAAAAVDGGLAAATEAVAAADVTRRAHTISAAGYGNIRARACVTSETFQDQYRDDAGRGFLSQTEADALQKRASMSLQRQGQRSSQGYSSSSQQQLNQQQFDQPFKQQQHDKYQQQQLYNEGIAASQYGSLGDSSSIVRSDGMMVNEEQRPNSDSVRSSCNVNEQYRYTNINEQNTNLQKCLCPHPSINHVNADGCHQQSQCCCPTQPPVYAAEHSYRLNSLSGSSAINRLQVNQSSSSTTRPLSSSSSHYAVPNVTGVRQSTSSDGDGSATADIYARPSLLQGRRQGAGPVPVAMPIIPGDLNNGAQRCSQRYSARIAEEDGEQSDVQTNKDSRAVAIDQSLPLLKSSTSVLPTSTTECINLNGLLESIDSVILLSPTDPNLLRQQQQQQQQQYQQQQLQQHFDKENLPIPPSPRSIELQYPKRPLWLPQSNNEEAHVMKVGCRSGAGEEFPPPPPFMMMFSSPPPPSEKSSYPLHTFNQPLNNATPNSVNARNYVSAAGETSLVVQGESSEDGGSLLAAIRNVQLRKTTSRQSSTS